MLRGVVARRDRTGTYCLGSFLDAADRPAWTRAERRAFEADVACGNEIPRLPAGQPLASVVCAACFGPSQAEALLAAAGACAHGHPPVAIVAESRRGALVKCGLAHRWSVATR
jgi:hypothetical protein